MGAETPLSSSEGKGGSDGKNKSWLLSNVDPDLYELANLLKNLIESKDRAVPKSTVLEKVIFPHIQKRPGAILMLTLIPTQRYKSISKIELGVKNIIGIYNSQLLRFYASRYIGKSS